MDSSAGAAIPGVSDADQVVLSWTRPKQAGRQADWPSWLPDGVRASMIEAGIERPWEHQVEFANLAHARRHSAITTPTASGKSLAYLMAVLGAEPRPPTRGSLRSLVYPTSLYLAPTKALAHDQLEAARAFAPAGWPMSTLDGDSSASERRFARDARFVLSNPDMIHRSILPNHSRWSKFLSSLQYIIVDEAHRYRGAFGAHVANILRRLRRVSAFYQAAPTVLLSSATSPNTAEFGCALIGDEVAVVSRNTAREPAQTMLGWRPSVSPTHDTTMLLSMLVSNGLQTIAFVASRKLAEVIAMRARELSGDDVEIASYRGGYLASERRELERRLKDGTVRGVAATNALELGVDISGMDAVVVHGYPGTNAALFQQFGRAGRSAGDRLGILVAADNPLDAYLFDHPELLFSGTIENLVVFPDNPNIMGLHLAAAAAELPLSQADERWFGSTMGALADHLTDSRLLRKRAAGWYWTRPDRPVDFIDIRSSSGAAFEVVERRSSRVLGTVDASTADATLHVGAVYLHQGEHYVVLDYDIGARRAIVIASRVRYYTQPLTTMRAHILKTTSTKPLGRGTLSCGMVEMTSQVTGYLRRDEHSSDVLDQTPIDLPERSFTTQATWWTIPPEVISDAGIDLGNVGPAAHAMEHCAIGLLPAFATCDRWDIGGLSVAMHDDTGMATVFVHDGMEGGAGFAAQGFAKADAWLAATYSRLNECRCEDGCPSCVVSPKCGNANQFLNRFAARDLLALLLDE